MSRGIHSPSPQRNTYPGDCTGKPSAVANARQKKVNADYHRKANELETRCSKLVTTNLVGTSTRDITLSAGGGRRLGRRRI